MAIVSDLRASLDVVGMSSGHAGKAGPSAGAVSGSGRFVPAGCLPTARLRGGSPVPRNRRAPRIVGAEIALALTVGLCLSSHACTVAVQHGVQEANLSRKCLTWNVVSPFCSWTGAVTAQPARRLISGAVATVHAKMALLYVHPAGICHILLEVGCMPHQPRPRIEAACFDN